MGAGRLSMQYSKGSLMSESLLLAWMCGTPTTTATAMLWGGPTSQSSLATTHRLWQWHSNPPRHLPGAAWRRGEQSQLQHSICTCCRAASRHSP